jgi:hypothetical protein
MIFTIVRNKGEPLEVIPDLHCPFACYGKRGLRPMHFSYLFHLQQPNALLGRYVGDPIRQPGPVLGR